ncbi:MAG: VOC family protein [Nitrososphaerales archaeon]|jgi:catechol 2,3-dioxygenase-like lactoylglutathione lyase family enzyme
MTITGLDTVAIVVSDKRRAIEWYRDVLGLKVAYVGPPESNKDPTVQGRPENPGHWIEMGMPRPMTRVHLCQLQDGRTEPGPTGITFLSDNIMEDYWRMKTKGVRFLSAPERTEWGEWLCEFADPDGNEFDLKQWTSSP